MKATAIVTRQMHGRLHILCFRHPLAGTQIVKGTVRAGERPIRAALRELREESGIAARHGAVMANVAMPNGLRWALVKCSAAAGPKPFTNFCADDGGHMFSFFWYPIAKPPGQRWHPMYRRALKAAQRVGLSSVRGKAR